MSSWYPPAPSPRAVEGGLRARSRRGAIAQSWWSERFVTVLESIGLGNRLQRGRNYARRGQVVSLDINAGAVTAVVQGSRVRPYRVRIGITAYGKAQWAQLERALAEDAFYAAHLLAGEMPGEIEDLFGSLELPLFPIDSDELSMDCSCPDWQVPCKHIAAAFYLLAEAFDDDPFAILAWRGRDRETLLANLAAARPSEPRSSGQWGAARPLEECLDTYFEMPTLPSGEGPLSGRRPIMDGLSTLERAPDITLALGGNRLTELLRSAYLAFGAAESAAEESLE